VDKGYPAGALDDALRNAAQAGIDVEATVMIGLPEDRADSVRETTDAVLRLFREDRLKLVHYFLCVPWPGTAIGDHPAGYGVEVVCHDHAHLITAPSIPLASTRHLSAHDVFSLWEEGVARLAEETRQKLMFQRIRESFPA
jgi:hypothetical protein